MTGPTDSTAANLTADEAQKAMAEGHKVAHRFFMDGEWIMRHKDVVVSEDGVVHANFFSSRAHEPAWQTDWFIVE